MSIVIKSGLSFLQPRKLLGRIPLAYLQSTGTQYIDLGIKPSDDMEFEIEYQSLAARGTKLFGCEANSRSLFDAYNVGRGGGTIRVFAHGGNNGGSPTDITTIAGQKTNLKLVIKNGTYSVYVNGELVATSPASGTVPNLSIFLFAVNRNGSADGGGSQIISSCKVKKSDELVGKFRPFLIDGKPGFLNIIDKSFHTNLGSGEFIAGYNLDNYIHDAANLFLDGIWNSGEGVHSDTLTEWVDLSGNCQPTPLNTANTVGTNCVTSDGTANSKMTVPDVELINLTTFTLELIYQKTGVNSKNQPIIGRNYASSYYVNTFGGTLMVWIGNKSISVGKNMDETAMHTLQVTCTGTTATAWVDGIKAAENYAVNAQNTSDKLLLFGSDFISACFDGSIMAVRLHNRILTDDELAQNFEVDKIRFNLPKIYGVSWDGTSTTAFSRTDDAELFTNPIPYVAGATSYGSPFDNISPWKDMQIVNDATAGKLVKIPKYYYKWTKSGDTMKLQISAEPFEGSLVSPAHADRGDGKGERDVVYVGRYHCNSSYKSAAGSNPLVNKTRATARTNIHNLGSTYWQYDFAMYWTICMLYLVEFADWNSQTKIGYGCSTNGSVMSMGYTDSMPYHTGTTAPARTSYGGTQYRNIEGLWDNVYDWCDGVYFSGANVYCIKNPASFSDTSGGTLVGTRPASGGYITSWSIPTSSGFEYALYPASVGGSSKTYTPDSCGYDSSGVVLNAGGVYGQYQSYGLFCLGGNRSASYSDSQIGSRLQKLP